MTVWRGLGENSKMGAGSIVVHHHYRSSLRSKDWPLAMDVAPRASLIESQNLSKNVWK